MSRRSPRASGLHESARSYVTSSGGSGAAGPLSASLELVWSAVAGLSCILDAQLRRSGRPLGLRIPER